MIWALVMAALGVLFGRLCYDVGREHGVAAEKEWSKYTYTQMLREAKAAQHRYLEELEEARRIRNGMSRDGTSYSWETIDHLTGGDSGQGIKPAN